MEKPSTAASCPYCSSVLVDIPKRKSKCPTCSKYIYIREGKLLTAEQAGVSRAPKARLKSSVDQRQDRRAKFSKSLTQWFESRKYQMGVPTDEIDTEKDVKAIEKGLGVIEDLVGPFMPYVISGKITSQHLFDAIVPFLQLSDLFGYSIDANTNRVAIVIYADKLQASVLAQRLDQLFVLARPLTELGIRMNGQSMAAGYIHVLLVYFDASKCKQAVSALLPSAAKRDAMGRTYLYTGFINVPDKSVTWSEESGGLGAIRRTMAGLLGTTKKVFRIFDEQDLRNILILSERAD